jgi:hypothetical protein
MIQLRDQARFTREAFAEFGFGNFDRDRAVEPRIAGFVDLAHAARANRREYFIRAEFRVRRKWHWNLVQCTRSKGHWTWLRRPTSSAASSSAAGGWVQWMRSLVRY